MRIYFMPLAAAPAGRRARGAQPRHGRSSRRGPHAAEGSPILTVIASSILAAALFECLASGSLSILALLGLPPALARVGGFPLASLSTVVVGIFVIVVVPIAVSMRAALPRIATVATLAHPVVTTTVATVAETTP